MHIKYNLLERCMTSNYFSSFYIYLSLSYKTPQLGISHSQFHYRL
jgi:hypothetical protein